MKDRRSSTRTFPKGRLALDFANTAACPGCRVGDGLASSATFRRWTRDHQELAAPPNLDRELPHLRELRAALVSLFRSQAHGGRPSATALRTVNATAIRSEQRRVLGWQRGGWALVDVDRPTPPAARVAGSLARDAIALLASPARSKLQACRGTDCVHFLLARTQTQMWCSASGCGNRARVARHYRRTRRAGSSLVRSNRV
ncbi:MAG: ABATE domain-containing protein [Euryarchaeota archaeon]|nr:ABATE domain-containing protein [Euryarchaeota archaeon]MDE1835396.1 ABATE domain-containing protein [Euryarchaeota archaeon]MDE1880499.1 ABATE domain-containing protein [Euryarchaeota archaeon]MDE2043692.1 ABATE domain-containing protein [Thermoplasmata archaeon]